MRGLWVGFIDRAMIRRATIGMHTAVVAVVPRLVFAADRTERRQQADDQ
jgi:hypothetical protein